MSKLGDNIRLIARTKQLEDKLKQLETRLPIPGVRGIGYQTDNDGQTSATGMTGTPGASTAPGQSSKDSNSTGVDENGNPLNPNNSGSDSPTGDTKEVSQDAADLLDNDEDKIGDALTELTGLKDCNTGKDVIVNMTGQGLFKGGGEAWGESSSPPLDLSWSLNTEVVDDATGEFFSSGQVWFDRFSPLYIEPSPYNDWELKLDTFSSAIWFIWSDDGGGAARSASIVACVAGASDTCLITPPYAQTWPVTSSTNLNEYQLSLGSDGLFRTSPYDPGAPKDFQPTDNLTLCFGEGNARKMRIESNTQGGKNVYEVTPSGRPIGTARVYDKNATLLTKVDAATQLHNFQPQ